ncbi:hypothetical protein Bhyg_03214, partial [Pseudolycoriella hygida]
MHWDGKKLKDKTNEDKKLRNTLVDRTAVVLSGIDTEKIVTVARAENGKGLVAAYIVYENVQKWNCLESIIAKCTDTTFANTGCTNGAVVLFEKLMKKNLLYLACRHHMFELVIGAIFIQLFEETTAPSSPMFENFKRDWCLIDESKFAPLNTDIFKKSTYLRKLRNSPLNTDIFKKSTYLRKLRNSFRLYDICINV